MNKIHVIAKRDHLESLTTVKRPLDAVAQLVWNGLDALSDRVQVLFDTNGMGGLEAIRIRDYGTGAPTRARTADTAKRRERGERSRRFGLKKRDVDMKWLREKQ